ncbi:expressed unknown protein [Seminavis robusta]|uniref:Uncharacterized protein n=1 Tax=Seminavis robusta TaxID=568900 RepID=A0A9N8H9M3_9STRA|nr:expressed unknown protein [Seminavis robusta]|eukprot:Sro121_g058920.1 n/a (182) ;mRNA; f:64573-65118
MNIGKQSLLFLALVASMIMAASGENLLRAASRGGTVAQARKLDSSSDEADEDSGSNDGDNGDVDPADDGSDGTAENIDWSTILEDEEVVEPIDPVDDGDSADPGEGIDWASLIAEAEQDDASLQSIHEPDETESDVVSDPDSNDGPSESDVVSEPDSTAAEENDSDDSSDDSSDDESASAD